VKGPEQGWSSGDDGTGGALAVGGTASLCLLRRPAVPVHSVVVGGRFFGAGRGSGAAAEPPATDAFGVPCGGCGFAQGRSGLWVTRRGGACHLVCIGCSYVRACLAGTHVSWGWWVLVVSCRTAAAAALLGWCCSVSPWRAVTRRGWSEIGAHIMASSKRSYLSFSYRVPAALSVRFGTAALARRADAAYFVDGVAAGKGGGEIHTAAF